MTLTSDNENMLIVDELAIGNKTYDIPKQGRCQGMMKKGNEGALESLVLRIIDEELSSNPLSRAFILFIFTRITPTRECVVTNVYTL